MLGLQLAHCLFVVLLGRIALLLLGRIALLLLRRVTLLLLGRVTLLLLLGILLLLLPHVGQIVVLEGILKGHIILRHNLRRPASLEGTRHSISPDHREDNLNNKILTIGTLVLTRSEQQSQEISWMQTTLMLYWFDSSLPEHVGLISRLELRLKESLMASLPFADYPAFIPLMFLLKIVPWSAVEAPSDFMLTV